MVTVIYLCVSVTDEWLHEFSSLPSPQISMSLVYLIFCFLPNDLRYGCSLDNGQLLDVKRHLISCINKSTGRHWQCANMNLWGLFWFSRCQRWCVWAITVFLICFTRRKSWLTLGWGGWFIVMQQQMRVGMGCGLSIPVVLIGVMSIQYATLAGVKTLLTKA